MQLLLLKISQNYGNFPDFLWIPIKEVPEDLRNVQTVTKNYGQIWININFGKIGIFIFGIRVNLWADIGDTL